MIDPRWEELRKLAQKATYRRAMYTALAQVEFHRAVTPEIVLELIRATIGPEHDTPTYQCAECGSLGPFKGIVYPSSPNGPEEYDMECPECSSLNIAESPIVAFHEATRKLDTRAAKAEAELERLLAPVPPKRKEHIPEPRDLPCGCKAIAVGPGEWMEAHAHETCCLGYVSRENL